MHSAYFYKKCWFIFFSFLITAYFIYPTKLQFDIKFGFGGYSVPGYWVPLFIKINQDIKSGRIEIERLNNKNNFPKEIFPCNKNNTIECPVFIDENIYGLVIRLFSDNDLLIERSVKLDEKIFPGHIILTSNINSKIQQSIAHSLFPEEPIQVVSLNLEDLPSVGLNYDCISALVMPDPGNQLTPAQINAIKFWIASGGKLILFNLLSGRESILNKFNEKNLSSENKVTIISGYGKINGFYEDASVMEFSYTSSEWRKILEIKPFTHNLRLTSSKSFKSEDDLNKIKADNSFIRTILLVCLASWIIFFLIILFFIRKRIFLLSIYTIVSVLIFAGFGVKLKRIWHGGAQYHNRMLILPGNNGLAIDSNIWFPQNATEIGLNHNFSLWGIKLDIGTSEKGFIYPWFGKNSLFVHNINKPEYALKNGTGEFINISSYMTFDKLDNVFLKNLLMKNNQYHVSDIQSINFHDKSKLVLVKGNNLDIEWWIWDNINYKWKKDSIIPEWLNHDLQWIIQLKKMKPDGCFLIGFDKIPGLNLKLQGELCSDTLWALPVL